MHTSSQLVSTGAQGVGSGTRRGDDRRTYVLSNVHELPLRLECVVADGFGGLVGSHAASCVTTTAINHRRGALS